MKNDILNMLTATPEIIEQDSKVNDDDEIINELACISSIDYERQRENAAKELGISILDVIKHKNPFAWAVDRK